MRVGYTGAMRTTVALDPDVQAEIDRRRSAGAGLSSVVNDLIRAGISAKPAQRPFVQQSSPMHARIDLRNIADVLETIDGPAAP